MPTRVFAFAAFLFLPAQARAQGVDPVACRSDSCWEGMGAHDCIPGTVCSCWDASCDADLGGDAIRICDGDAECGRDDDLVCVESDSTDVTCPASGRFSVWMADFIYWECGICEITCACCGDGIIGGGEECDDGNVVDEDDCTAECLDAECGDGLLHDGIEECDDGNLNTSDDCPDACLTARCGDGYVWFGHEDCDDGNDVSNDGCEPDCTEPYCGDGEVWEGHEECDDGNEEDGDGCSEECTIEDPAPDAGPDADSDTDSDTDADTDADADADTDADTDADIDADSDVRDSGGCGCSLPGSHPLGAFLLLALFALRRRSR